MLPKHFLAATKQATRTNMLNTTTEVTLQAVRKCKIIKITENTNKKKQKQKQINKQTKNTPEVTSCKNKRQKQQTNKNRKWKEKKKQVPVAPRIG